MLDPDLRSGPPAAPKRRRALEGVRALRHVPFRILALALVARGLQVWMQFVALPLLVLELGGSAAEVGLVTGLFLLPIVVIAPAAGVLGDRVDRRRALIAFAAYGAVHGLVMAAVVVSGAMTIPLLALFAALYGVLNAVEIPVRLAFISEVVADEDLANGVVTAQLAFISTRIVGPAVAGLVAAGPGVAALFTIIGALGLVVAGATWSIRVPYPFTRRTDPGSPLAALAAGLRYAARTPQVRAPLALLGIVAIFGLSFQVVLPFYAVDRLALDRHHFGGMLAVMGIGGLIASVPMAYLRPTDARRVMLGAAGATAIAIVALSVTTLVVASFALVAVAGAASNVSLSSASVALQDAVDGDVRARVLGLQAALFQGGQGIGGLLIGLATEAFGVVAAMLGGALLVGLATVTIWALWPRPRPP